MNNCTHKQNSLAGSYKAVNTATKLRRKLHSASPKTAFGKNLKNPKLIQNEKGVKVPYSLLDSGKVDEWRAEMDLPPMKEYLKQMNGQ